MKTMKRIIGLILAASMVLSLGDSTIRAGAALSYSLSGKYGFFRHYTTARLLYSSSITHQNPITATTYSSTKMSKCMWKIVLYSGSDYYIQSSSNSNLVLGVTPNNEVILVNKSGTIETNLKLWQFSSIGSGGYYLKSKGSGKYLTYTSAAGMTTVTSTGSVAWVFEPSTNQSSSVNADLDKFAPPISSNGTQRSEQYDEHKAVDIASAGVSKAVFAVDSGFAVYKQQIGTLSGQFIFYGWGNYVIMKGDNDIRVTVYAHLDSFADMASQIVYLNEGFPANGDIKNKKDSVVSYKNVSRGQRLGMSGTTGQSTGVHLHFEARTGFTVKSNDITGGTAISRSNLDNYYKIVGGKVN